MTYRGIKRKHKIQAHSDYLIHYFYVCIDSELSRNPINDDDVVSHQEGPFYVAKKKTENNSSEPFYEITVLSKIIFLRRFLLLRSRFYVAAQC